MVKYDCLKCPGYCCSYPVIAISEADVARLARHFDVTPEVAKRRFTKRAHGQDVKRVSKAETAAKKAAKKKAAKAVVKKSAAKKTAKKAAKKK